MRQRPERKASNGKYAKSKKNHDESAGLSDHFPVYEGPPLTDADRCDNSPVIDRHFTVIPSVGYIA